MKRFVTLSCLTFLFFACVEKEVDNQQEFIKATINGTAWEASDISLIQNNSQQFRGAIGEYNNSKIILSIPDTAKVTYNLREQSFVLVSFSVDYAESDYRLQWRTTLESNMAMFVVEASVANDNGIPVDWRPVDTVLSKGNGDHAYEAIIHVPGWEYSTLAFRLRGVDASNLSAYSNVRMMNQRTYTFYSASGQEPRRGYNSTLTVTGTEGPFVTGTFKFTIKSLTGQVTTIENGQFRVRYR
jgi:hypothetical protein